MNDVWKMFNFFTDDEVLPIDTKSTNMSNIVTCNNLPADFETIFDEQAPLIDIGNNKSDSVMLLDVQNDEICEAQNISDNKSEIYNEVVKTVQESSMPFNHIYCTNPNKKPKKTSNEKIVSKSVCEENFC